MISQKAKYAFHALVALARTESLMVGEIAAQEKIPRKFLEQILLELKRHGIVQSRRGKFGGYGLLLPADRITFGQVLRILDGPIAPLPCLSRIAYRRCSDCQTEENCERSGASLPKWPSQQETFSTAPPSPMPSGPMASPAMSRGRRRPGKTPAAGPCSASSSPVRLRADPSPGRAPRSRQDRCHEPARRQRCAVGARHAAPRFPLPRARNRRP